MAADAPRIESAKVRADERAQRAAAVPATVSAPAAAAPTAPAPKAIAASTPPNPEPPRITAGKLGPAIVPTKALDANAVPSPVQSLPTTKAAPRPRGPNGSVAIGGAAVSGGTVSNAARVVAGWRAGFRACYVRALQSDPDAGGSMRLTITVGPEGAVCAVAAAPSGNLPAPLVACVRARAMASQFAAPEGGSAKIIVPTTYVRQ